MRNHTPIEFPFRKPKCENGRSDLHVVHTDAGEVLIAIYDERTGLWYSLTDTKGFSNVSYFAEFETPYYFEPSEELEDLEYGRGAYEIKS